MVLTDHCGQSLAAWGHDATHFRRKCSVCHAIFRQRKRRVTTIEPTVYYAYAFSRSDSPPFCEVTAPTPDGALALAREKWPQADAFVVNSEATSRPDLLFPNKLRRGRSVDE